MRDLQIVAESWPLRQPFVISRLTQTHAELVTVTLSEAGSRGRGECERIDVLEPGAPPVLETLRALDGPLRQVNRETLAALLPAGNARNAVDCALWELQARQRGIPCHELAGLPPPGPLTTAWTIALAEPGVMAGQAARCRQLPLLKLKLGGEGDVERVRAVRRAAPEPRLIADVNQAWTADLMAAYAPALAELGVELLEQPLPVDEDACLAELPHPLPVCADESVTDRASLAGLLGRYDAVNIKLDKTGGLTEALLLADAAVAAGLQLMVGCNIGTSLAMAPALLLAQRARFVDLDGPLWLVRDREPALRYRDGVVYPVPGVWG